MTGLPRRIIYKRNQSLSFAILASTPFVLIAFAAFAVAWASISVGEVGTATYVAIGIGLLLVFAVASVLYRALAPGLIYGRGELRVPAFLRGKRYPLSPETRLGTFEARVRRPRSASRMSMGDVGLGEIQTAPLQGKMVDAVFVYLKAPGQAPECVFSVHSDLGRIHGFLAEVSAATGITVDALARDATRAPRRAPDFSIWEG